MVVQKTNKWSPTTRRATLDDGSIRVLFKNPMFPGELRIRKMRKGRDGRLTASYVRQNGRVRVIGGGTHEEDELACNGRPATRRGCEELNFGGVAACEFDKSASKCVRKKNIVDGIANLFRKTV